MGIGTALLTQELERLEVITHKAHLKTIRIVSAQQTLAMSIMVTI